MLLLQRDQQEEMYRVYKLEELELDRVIRLGPDRCDAAHLVQGERGKEVLVRRYAPEKKCVG